MIMRPTGPRSPAREAPSGPGPAGADGAATIVLTGRLDALRAVPLRGELDDLVARAAAAAQGVAVDLTDVVFVDSAALAALVRLRRQCSDAGLGLVLVRPRHVEALRIFRLTQFDEVFVMVDGRPR